MFESFAWIPCSTRGIPLIKWRDPATWRRDAPPENEIFAMPTGLGGNRFWVLDLDRKNGKDGLAALAAYAREHGQDLPESMVATTPSGGWHIYWDCAGRTIPRNIGLLPGVDVLGERAIVKSGLGYDEHPAFAGLPLVPAPDWLVALVTSAATASTEEPAALTAIPLGENDPRLPAHVEMGRRYLEAEPPCVSGDGGHAHLWNVARRLVRTYQLPEETALGLLQESYNATCEPPWSETELRHKLHEAATKAQDLPGLAVLPFAASTDADADAGAAAGAGAPKEWRQRPNPEHKYTISVHNPVTGPQIAAKATDLIGTFAGPHASEIWRGVWQYDELDCVVRAVNPPLPLEAEKNGLQRVDYARVQYWLGSIGWKTSIEAIGTAIDVAAHECRVHPIRDYLAGLPAPTTNHIEHLASSLMGDDSPYADDFVRKWLIGCVARMMTPGCQFDTALTLVGEIGGERKSSFLFVLAGPGRSRSNVPDIANGQAIGMAMRRQWIVELGELSEMNTAARSVFKEFITRRVEQFNAKYAIAEAVEPRQCGIAATTNRIDFLDAYDSATRRRFWPVLVQKRIAVEWVEEHRDEIWAEAYAAYMAGEQWWYADESAIDGAYPRFITVSPLAEQVAAYLDQPSQRASLNGLSATSVAQRVLGITHVDAKTRTELGMLLAKTPGVEKKRTSKGVVYSFGEAPVAKLKVVK